MVTYYLSVIENQSYMQKELNDLTAFMWKWGI